MATTLDLTALVGPCRTRYFAGGDAANWCVVSLPKWTRALTVLNRGAGALYVQVPGAAGAAAATDHAGQVPAGQARTFLLTSGQAPFAPTVGPTVGVWGADGAAHAMDLQIEAAS